MVAGGEGAHNVSMARQLIDYGKVGFVQIDCGRIGGIGPAKVVADYAAARGVTYVNHTFTSHLARARRFNPMRALPITAFANFHSPRRLLLEDITANRLQRDKNGEISAPDAPGLGIAIDMAALRRYLVDVEIKVAGRVLYATPELA